MSRIDLLNQQVSALLSDQILDSKIEFNELTINLSPDHLTEAMTALRDAPQTKFEQCIDVCGIDYLTYRDNYQGPRFAAVYHLLSIEYNWRLRVKVFAADDDFPIIPSVIEVWNAVDWFEREAFDLYGIVFDGHPDLRRILTDYGFIGHPFRKDFPISGYTEMAYDEAQQRVIYQPVSIEPREITPRIIREDGYGNRN